MLLVLLYVYFYIYKENYKKFNIIYGVHENMNTARLFTFNYNCKQVRKCCFSSDQEKKQNLLKMGCFSVTAKMFY